MVSTFQMLNSRNLLLMIITQISPVKQLFNTSMDGSSTRLIHQANVHYCVQQIRSISSSTCKAMASGTPVLLNTTVVFMTIGVFEAQLHFRTVFLQMQKLLPVKISTLLFF
jgi:hypothetical protein